MKKIQIGFVISIVVLFLGWLPKLGADRVFWYLENDFAHYYLTGALVRSGVNPYAVNLSPLYAENEFTPTRDIPQVSSPPPLAVVMAPFFSSVCCSSLIGVRSLGPVARPFFSSSPHWPPLACSRIFGTDRYRRSCLG